MKQHQAKIEKVSWQEVRKDVAAINPVLAMHIDNIDPSEHFPLFKAYYPFGSLILDRGQFNLPTKSGKVVPFAEADIPKSLRSIFPSDFIPTSLILSKSAEVFFELESRVVSLNYLSPGNFFGLWEALDPPQSYHVKNIWSIVSGARSLFMLPKITDANSHKELRKKYGVKSHLPKSLLEHWGIFAEIANSQVFKTEWHSQVLFFADGWVNSKQESKEWFTLRHYLLEDSWGQSQYGRNKVTFDFIWELFIIELIQQNIKPNPYLVKIVKHLILMGIGVAPGFTIADDDQAAPTKALQQVYIDDYKIKDYAPLIMQPHNFNSDENIPVYYSFHQPTLLETTPTSQNTPSILNSLIEVEFLMETFCLEIRQGNIDVAGTPLSRFSEEVSCEYFHSEVKADSHRPIQPTEMIPRSDLKLSKHLKSFNGRSFPEMGQFTRACVRLKSQR